MSEKKQVLNAAAAIASVAEVLARQEAAKQRVKDLQAYDKRVRGMSFRQLRGELRRESRKPSDGSLLTSGLASILLTVLNNTKTAENPTARSRMNPGW